MTRSTWLGRENAKPPHWPSTSLRAQPARSTLAILGVVIGIVTVVVVASTLVGLRNSIALLFRELGTDNIFAYHLNGEPYSAPTELDAARPQLRPDDALPLDAARPVDSRRRPRVDRAGRDRHACAHRPRRRQ